MGTLLRDPTSSHLLESLVRHLPSSIFDVVWGIYFKSKLARLSAHPVANFVVGKALERANASQLKDTCEELGPVSEKLFSRSPLWISADQSLKPTRRVVSHGPSSCNGRSRWRTSFRRPSSRIACGRGMDGHIVKMVILLITLNS